jgi:hypothetical protein
MSRYDRKLPSASRCHDPRCTSYVVIGASRALRRSRPAIQSPSAQSYAGSQTTLAVFGGTSQRVAKGSPLSTRYPPTLDATWNL